MGFGLGHGRDLDDALGVIGVDAAELPALPDAAATDPTAGLLDPRAWFKEGRERRFEIEIGCGKGTFILETGKACPNINYLGIEWAREFYLYAADRVRRAGLMNVRMLRTDAGDFLRWRCHANIADVIHLYFSDPWPKTKHHKNRVIQHRFLAEAWRVLVPGGELRVVTDHDDLWVWDEAHFAVWGDVQAYARLVAGEHLGPQGAQVPPPAGVMPRVAGVAPFALVPFEPPAWVGEGELVGTNYERKFKRDDRPAHSVTLRKQVL